MRALSLAPWACAAALLSCGSSATSTPEAAAPPPGWVRLYGVVTEERGPTLADYEICLTQPKQDPPRCTKSAADGTYTLYVPPSSQIVTTYTKEDYFREIGMGVTETTDIESNFGGLPLERGPLLAAAVDTTLDASKGQLVVSIFGPNAFIPNSGKPGGLEGVTFAISPPSGKGPFYTDSVGVPGKGFTSSTTSPLGGIINVDPGAKTASFKRADGKSCHLLAGWPGPTADTIAFLVEANTITHISADCR